MNHMNFNDELTLLEFKGIRSVTSKKMKCGDTGQ